MSRTMPTQCEHGEIVDWGDFGPCQGDCDHEGDCPNFPDCPDCMETRMTPEQTTAITKRVPNRPEHPSGWGPLVKGQCPACGLTSLFLGEGGYVTCASLSCTDPAAATHLLEQNGRSATPEPTRPDPSLTERQLWGGGSTDD